MRENNYTDEMLKKYISSVRSIIHKKRKDKKEWKLNEEYHSQVFIKKKGED